MSVGESLRAIRNLIEQRTHNIEKTWYRLQLRFIIAGHMFLANYMMSMWKKLLKK